MLSMLSNAFYDYLLNIIIISKDIWSDDISATPSQRSGVVGTSWVGGVCSSFRQSVIEDTGFNSILVNL